MAEVEELVLRGTVCGHNTDMVAAIATPFDNAKMTVTSSRDESIPIETTTKISDLPVNLVEEILSWVPLKYMREVRSTCKEWEALSKSRSFSKMHIDKLRSGESMMIAAVDYNLYLMKVVNEEDPFIECQGRLTCLDIQIKISEVFHCDGLLLCVSEDDDTKVAVWNPYLGQTRSVECRDPLREDEWGVFCYALGYEDKGSCRRSYKFLRFIDRWSCFEIYDFDSSSWKTLNITPHWRIRFSQLGVSLKGNTSFPASQINREEDNYIICFDFTSESFGPLLRLPFDAGDDDHVTLSCVREEKLAVLLTRKKLEFEIWISTEIEAEKVSWSKFLRVETEAGFYALVSCESFFIDEERKVAMGYYKTFNIVGEDGYLKELVLVERADRDVNYCSRPVVCSYVPSLVQINQPASGGGQRKHARLANRSSV